MESSNLSGQTNQEPLRVDDWPMNLQATRQELRQARIRVERYQAALRLAGLEIERRNKSILALTNFAYQAGRVVSPSDLLKLALTQAVNTLEAPMGAIVLIDADSKALILGTHTGLTPALSAVLTGRQIGIGATVLMPHLVSGNGALLEYHTSDDETERQLLTNSNLTSLVSLPLQIGPRLIGAFLVGLQGKRTFKPAEIYFLMAISHKTAIDLESFDLREGLWHAVETLLDSEKVKTTFPELEESELSFDISPPFELPETSAVVPEPADNDLEQLLAAMMEAEEEVQQQNMDLQTLNTISEMMNQSLNAEEIAQRAVEQTQKTLKTDCAWLYLAGSRKQLKLRAHVGLSEAYTRGMQILQFGDGLEGAVANENRAYFIDSIQSRPHKIWVDKEKLKAIAAVPLSRARSPINQTSKQPDSEVVGVLVVGKRSDTPYQWTPREVRLLTSIANQITLAIDNARLYSQVQEDQTGLQAGNEVLRQVNDMLLEKNVFLEGFIEEDLIPALGQSLLLLQDFLQESAALLPQNQAQKVVDVQKILTQLGQMTKETDAVSGVLNNEFNRVSQGQIGLAKPPRLEKTHEPQEAANLVPPEGKPTAMPPEAAPPPPLPPKTGPTEPAKAMSFEEAVAAGLVPSQILNRETDTE